MIKNLMNYYTEIAYNIRQVISNLKLNIIGYNKYI